MIELDGSFGEGGGALVRVALALSALTEQPFKVMNIRANRPEPGLKAQHLEAINSLKQICDAETNEIKISTTELYFQPKKIKRGTYVIDIGTAGSISLALQALVLPCMFAPGKVTLKIKGGTCGKWQASVHYLQNVLLPHLHKFVEKIELKILKPGYYPKGGGEVLVEITPRFHIRKFKYVEDFINELKEKVARIKLLEMGKLEQIRGVINLSMELEEKEVGERIRKAAESALKKYNVPINIRVEYSHSLSIGGEIVLWALFSRGGKIDSENPIILGSDTLIDKNKSSEQIGKEAAEKLCKEIDNENVVDRYLLDQLIPFMALLHGSEVAAKEISNHVQTNIYVCKQFIPVMFKIIKNKISVEMR
ncbi:RNA 3'-terminal phosphate cyclase [Candidatus Woesearchaeota archaeon]|nr:RNA 3'-terminal phosphate cyclase [Candidatus Woesearchaeota archaeon]